ncbi:MAG: peptidase, partial [Limosilactobacillus fermentum]
MAVTRFYEAFHPTHYDIKLDINRQAKQFAGHVTIDGEALTKTISLHQKFLQVTSVTTEGRTLSFETSDEQEALTFTLPKTGPVAVTVDYTAPLTDTMMGIYPSYYQVDGQQKELIGTQFETTFARQAFPSIDEPEAKATFSLAIKFDEQPGETVLANMPEERVEDGYHYFEETVKMS